MVFSNLLKVILAMGINVIRTVRWLGIPIEDKPQNLVFKVALIAHPIDSGGDS